MKVMRLKFLKAEVNCSTGVKMFAMVKVILCAIFIISTALVSIFLICSIFYLIMNIIVIYLFMYFNFTFTITF